MRRLALTCAMSLALAGIAGANGRPAGTSSIQFQQGNAQNVVTGMTFGFMRSTDGGVTWKWMCEAAVGYSGTYDPVYAYSASGAVFATTFNGLEVMRDNCSFSSSPPGTPFVSTVTLAPNGDVYIAAADPNDATIYKSTNDGVNLQQMLSPGQPKDLWDTLKVASDSQRVYLTGYRFNKKCNAASSNPGTTCTMDVQCPGGMCESVKQFLLFTSANGGSTPFTEMSQTGLLASNFSAMDVVGISPTDPKTVYLRINLETGTSGDSIYKSTDAGATWTKILTTNDAFGLVFLARSNGDLIAATKTSGAQVSTNGGTTWTPLVNPPHISCLVENPGTHDVWACTENYDSIGITGDGFGIMKTTDYASWTGVQRYQDISGVVQCDAATPQAAQCVSSYQGQPSVWCCLEAQLGITDSSVDCTGANSCAFTGDSAENVTVSEPKGCCNTGGSGAGYALLAAGTGALLWRRRKR